MKIKNAYIIIRKMLSRSNSEDLAYDLLFAFIGLSIVSTVIGSLFFRNFNMNFIFTNFIWFPIWIWFIISIFLVLFFLMSVKIIPQGYHYTVERFGRYIKTLYPGIQFIWPVIDRIGYRVVMMETFLDVPSIRVIIKGNTTIEVDTVVFYQIADAERAAYKIENLTDAILNLTMTSLFAMLGTKDFEEIITKRHVINSDLLEVLKDATPWGVTITRCKLKDINLIINENKFVKEEDISSIIRTIDFPSEYYHAGMTILSNFTKIVRERYSKENISISIRQEGLKVILIIKTDEGEKEEIEEMLENYGSLMRGEISPEDFASNDLQALEIKQQLRIAQIQIENQRDILALEKKRTNDYGERVEFLERRYEDLTNLLSMAFEKPVNTPSYLKIAYDNADKPIEEYDNGKHKSIYELEKHLALLRKKISKYQEDRINETRSDEKFRLKNLIDEAENEYAKIEAKLKSIRS